MGLRFLPVTFIDRVVKKLTACKIKSDKCTENYTTLRNKYIYIYILICEGQMHKFSRINIHAKIYTL